MRTMRIWHYGVLWIETNQSNGQMRPMMEIGWVSAINEQSAELAIREKYLPLPNNCWGFTPIVRLLEGKGWHIESD